MCRQILLVWATLVFSIQVLHSQNLLQKSFLCCLNIFEFLYNIEGATEKVYRGRIFSRVRPFYERAVSDLGPES